MNVTVKSQLSHSARIIKRIILLFVAIASTFAAAIAQDTKQGLARPEWQLRADLEFRFACQSSLQKLCLEVIQTHQKDPSDPANSKRLSIAGSLLETTDGKLPTTLPEHPASIEYVKARKAAVIEWNKAYKAKGRDLPSIAIDAERKFQETYRELIQPSPSTTPGNATNGNSNTPTLPEEPVFGNSNSDQGTEGNETGTDKKSENRLSDATVKNAANLIKEIEKYYSTNPSGETTIEKQASSLLLKRAAFSLVEKQPDYFLTYPIEDVTSSDKQLEFRVGVPLEFEQLQKEIGTELQLVSRNKSILVQTPTILKKWKSIKPGDLLRVRMKIGVLGLNVEARDQTSKQISFSVANALAFDQTRLAERTSDRLQKTATKIFVEKSIVEFQIAKPPLKASSP